MGALRGSISVRRYAVVDPLPGEVRRRFLKGLRAHAFLPLDPKADSDQSIGWVSMLDQEDADLQPDKVFFVARGGEQLRISLRTDVLKPSPSEVRRQTAARATALEAERGTPLSRGEKRALKLEVARGLKLRSLPRVRVTDLVWDLDSGRLRFWSLSKSTNEAFLDLFAKSFGLRIGTDGPARWARGLRPGRTLDQLMPTPELWLGFEGVRPLPSAPEEA